MKQLFLNRERIACMFLCVCARAVCVCNLSLFVRKAFLPPHRSGSPLSAVLTHLFHFACIALAPSPSSLLLRSLAFFPLCHLPHPSPLLVSSRLSFAVFCSRPKKNQTWLFCLGVLSASSWSDDLPPPASSRKSHLAWNLPQVEWFSPNISHRLPPCWVTPPLTYL